MIGLDELLCKPTVDLTNLQKSVQYGDLTNLRKSVQYGDLTNLRKSVHCAIRAW